MDFGIIDLQKRSDPFFVAFEPARDAMGDTRRVAERMNLIAVEPRGDLSSTGYVIANPGKEYLVLQPAESGGAFTAELAAGSYAVQWYSINSRESIDADKVIVENLTSIRFSAPFEQPGPAVLYLTAV
jgi:hypothetical protein